MKENGFISTFEQSLSELSITKNAIAVESKVRPATIADLQNGQAKQINFETLKAIIDAMNRMAAVRGKEKVYAIEDVFTYESTQKAPE
ncbi:XRE family transcriptional regulator [Bacillus mesophilum]|uniref:XRE family transcriptional regulator n=2 Tax=Bacillus mesophilum TaxID=1071718 RepID=A0A7V7RN68_9BACI|nr:XRE family transcriptional regulator [Bacillus mesophilum]